MNIGAALLSCMHACICTCIDLCKRRREGLVSRGYAFEYTCIHTYEAKIMKCQWEKRKRGEKRRL